MFKAQPMSRVSLLCLASEAQEAALLLARFGGFGPAAEAAGELSGQPGAEYREVYLEAEARLDKIMEFCGRPVMPPPSRDSIAPSLRELKGINGRLREIWQACSGCHEQEIRLAEERKRLETLKETYARLRALDVDLSRLLRRDGLLDARLGQVPAANLKRLAEALSVGGYLLTVFDRTGDTAFVVVAGPNCLGTEGRACGLGGLLSQAGWRELPVPPELQTHPQAATRYLESEGRRLEEMAASHCELRDRQGARYMAWLGQARQLLLLARPLAESSPDGLRGRGQMAMFTGWVPARRLVALESLLRERFHGRHILTSREPGPGDGAVPSCLAYPAWLRPFVPLVKSYGVPRYGEFDPALLFALAYVLLFGAMFGDVGHGAVLLTLALTLRGSLAWLRGVGMAAGAASILFGVLYGSVFGYEELIHPVWQSPLHDPVRLLLLAVGGGVLFIALTLLINIYNRVVAGKLRRALLDGDGLAGLALYLALTGGVAGLAAGHGFGLANGLAATAALGTVAAWKWAETPAEPGERLIVTLIESLETVTNLFANTLSFLRVAAFSLNHVALALAVFTIANGLGAVGHGIAVVLGNVLIIVLEGGIVAIQALRLMYYEGFSRFYNGDGIEFRPLRLASNDG